MADVIDRACALEERERDGALAQHHARRRRELNDAPAGDATRHCTGCGDPIPRPRLRAVPHARRCIDCERTREKTHQHYART